MASLNDILTQTTASPGGAQRIKDTPLFPFYDTVLRWALLVFMMIFPMVPICGPSP